MTSDATVEVNFDAIPGPTHNYSGLAFGNLAAERNAELVSNPREAALQGLAKMRALAARGYAQAVLPPHERPALWALRDLGFAGDDADVLRRAAVEAPRLLAACSSAAAMWAANAATVSASARHRRSPRALHGGEPRGELPSLARGGDDDARAARDLRGCEPVRRARPAAVRAATRRRGRGEPYAVRRERRAGGRRALRVRPARVRRRARRRRRYPARQTFEASAAIARRHGLDASRTVFAQQNPAAIDAGVFHNDVIAVGSGALLFCHEHAYVDQRRVLRRARKRGRRRVRAIVVRGRRS